MSNNIQSIIDSIITKFGHDLINPLGTAAMALENRDLTSLQLAIDSAILKLDMFRFLYRSNISNDMQYEKLKHFVINAQLNMEFKAEPKHLAGFLFWVSQKMLSKSSCVVEKDKITIKYAFMMPNEIEAINHNNFSNITTENILIYLAYTQYKNSYTLNIKNLENNEWEILIRNISNLKG